MLRRRTRFQLFTFVLITLVGVSYVSAEYVGLTKAFLSDGCTVSADFPDSGGIFTNAEVTFRGVTVGKVGALHLTKAGVRVDLRLDDCSSPKIPADVSATVTDRSVLGEQYVDLKPPPRTNNGGARDLRKGAVIPMARNRIPTDATTLLTNMDRLVNSVSTEDLRTMITELAGAFGERGPDLERLLEATDQFLATASEPQNRDATIQLIKQSSSVLQTQLDLRDPLRSWARDLNLLSQQLAGSDTDVRHLLTMGPHDLTTVRDFIGDNKTDLGVTLANIAATGELLVRRRDGVEEVLELYPLLAAGSQTVVYDGSARTAIVVQSKPEPDDCGDPGRGREGYDGTVRRFPTDLSPMAPNVAARCTAPATGRGAKNVRGSAHAPGGDPLSLSGGGYAYPSARTANTLRIGPELTSSNNLGDGSWLRFLTAAFR
jgi:phospholipid/cholesterol/gamma-HCH transport system substrate-binding protein